MSDVGAKDSVVAHAGTRGEWWAYGPGALGWCAILVGTYGSETLELVAAVALLASLPLVLYATARHSRARRPIPLLLNVGLLAAFVWLLLQPPTVIVDQSPY